MYTGLRSSTTSSTAPGSRCRRMALNENGKWCFMQSKAGAKSLEFTVTLLKLGETPISVTALKSLSRYMRICSRGASDQEILSLIRSVGREQSFLLLIPFSAELLES